VLGAGGGGGSQGPGWIGLTLGRALAATTAEWTGDREPQFGQKLDWVEFLQVVNFQFTMTSSTVNSFAFGIELALHQPRRRTDMKNVL